MDFLSKYYRHLWRSAFLPLADVPNSHIFIGTFAPQNGVPTRTFCQRADNVFTPITKIIGRCR
jgi:hypothetical protein